MTITDQELAALYDRYAHIVYRRCLSILRNEEDAHDAVQETFARVIRHNDEFRGKASPLTWMYRISTNYCLNQLRNHVGRRAKLELSGGRIRGIPSTSTGPADAAYRLTPSRMSVSMAAPSRNGRDRLMYGPFINGDRRVSSSDSRCRICACSRSSANGYAVRW